GGWEGGVGPCRWSLRASARPDAPLPTSPTPGTARGRRPDYVTPAPPPTVRGQGRLCRGRRSSLRTPPPTVRGRGRLGGGRRSLQMVTSGIRKARRPPPDLPHAGDGAGEEARLCNSGSSPDRPRAGEAVPRTPILPPDSSPDRPRAGEVGRGAS